MSLNYNGFSKLGKNHPQAKKWKEDQLHGEGSKNSYEFLVNQLGHDREELGSSNNRWFNTANVPGSDAYDALTCKAMPADGHNDEDIELEDGWLIQKKENSDSDQYSEYPHYILFSKDGSTLMTGFGQSFANDPTFSIYDMNKVGDKYEFTKSGDVDMSLAGPRTSWYFNNSGNDGLMTRSITSPASPFKNSISLTKNSLFGLYDTDGFNFYARQAGFVVRQRDDSNTVWDENTVKSTFMYDVEFSLLTSADSAENLSSGEIYGVVGDHNAPNHVRSGSDSSPVNPNSRICFFHALPFENWDGWPIVKLNKTQYGDIFDPDNNAGMPAWADAHDINANGEDRSSGLQDSDEAYFSFQSIRVDGIGSWAREGRYPGLEDLHGGGYSDHSACKAYAPGQTNNGQTFDTWTGDSTWDALDNYHLSVHPQGIRTSLGTSIKAYFDAQNIDYSTNFWKYRSDQVMVGTSLPHYPVVHALMNGESAFPKYFFTENHDKEISGAISSDDNKIGSAVSLSEDGQTVAYSSEWTDDPDVFLENNRGWVKVLTWNESTKAWDQIGDTLKGDNAGDYFGRFVKLSPDGKFLVVGGAKTAKVFQKEPDVTGSKWTQKGANISIETLIQNDWTENSWGNPDSTHLSKCQIESINIGRPNDTNDELEDENTRIYIGCPLAPSGIADADHGLRISGGSESADGTVNATCFGAIFVLEWSTTDSEWKTNVSSANFSKAIFGTNGAIYNHSRGLQSDLSKTGTINTTHYPSYHGGRFPMTIGYCFSTAAVGELFAFGGWNNFLNCNNSDLDCSRPKDVAELTQAFILSRYVLVDSDEDGVSDVSDAFPDDPSEWGDIDADGVGDNSDAFPKDSSETADSDGDGVGDNADLFPNDPNKTSNQAYYAYGDDGVYGVGYYYPVYLSDDGLGPHHTHQIDAVTYYMEDSDANHAQASLPAGTELTSAPGSATGPTNSTGPTGPTSSTGPTGPTGPTSGGGSNVTTNAQYGTVENDIAYFYDGSAITFEPFGHMLSTPSSYIRNIEGKSVWSGGQILHPSIAESRYSISLSTDGGPPAGSWSDDPYHPDTWRKIYFEYNENDYDFYSYAIGAWSETGGFQGYGPYNSSSQDNKWHFGLVEDSQNAGYYKLKIGYGSGTDIDNYTPEKWPYGLDNGNYSS